MSISLPRMGHDHHHLTGTVVHNLDRSARSLVLSSPSAAPSQSPNRHGHTSSSRVYLLNKKAHGRAGARLPGYQNIFMNLMDLTDDCIPTKADGSDWSCPIPVEEPDIFAAASNHSFVKQQWQGGRADGYVHMGNFDAVLDAVSNGECRQCDCVAHEKSDILEPDSEDIKQMIRTPPILCQASGNNYAVALLRQLFKAMNLPIFIPMSTGSVDRVSYVLLCEKTEYSFHGVPYYLVHKRLVWSGPHPGGYR